MRSSVQPRAFNQAGGLLVLLLTLLLRSCVQGDSGESQPAVSGVPGATRPAATAVPATAPTLNPTAAPTVTPTATPATGGVPIGPLQVDAVEVVVLESDPPQVQAVVRATLPNPCATVGPASQTREGTTITVALDVLIDPDAFCADVLQPVEQVIPLGGDFPPGSYTVTVNGVSATFTV